jgi:hypothetical protein
VEPTVVKLRERRIWMYSSGTRGIFKLTIFPRLIKGHWSSLARPFVLSYELLLKGDSWHRTGGKTADARLLRTLITYIVCKDSRPSWAGVDYHHLPNLTCRLPRSSGELGLF